MRELIDDLPSRSIGHHRFPCVKGLIALLKVVAIRCSQFGPASAGMGSRGGPAPRACRHLASCSFLRTRLCADPACWRAGDADLNAAIAIKQQGSGRDVEPSATMQAGERQTRKPPNIGRSRETAPFKKSSIVEIRMSGTDRPDESLIGTRSAHPRRRGSPRCGWRLRSHVKQGG